VNTVRN